MGKVGDCAVLLFFKMIFYIYVYCMYRYCQLLLDKKLCDRNEMFDFLFIQTSSALTKFRGMKII